jgi:hypothetical protein
MITSAACRATINSNEIVVIRCHRHCDFFETMKLLHIDYDKSKVEQGFIAYDPKTRKEEFVNRVDAWLHARECGQIKSNEIIGTLYSEDLW